MNKFTPTFIAEAFNFCLKNKTIFETIRGKIEYSFFPEDYHKKVWKYFSDYFDTHERLPSIGTISQTFAHDDKMLSFIAEIRNASAPTKDEFLQNIEEFIKQMSFVKVYDEVADLYNKGLKEEVYKKLHNFVEFSSQFTLREVTYDSVFKGFGDRHKKKLLEQEMIVDAPKHFRFGIDELDYYSDGFRLKDTVLLLGQSGSGKSQALKHIAISNSRRGMKVAHFQLEDSKEACMDSYDSAWTGTKLADMEYGKLSEKTLEKINKIRTNITGEIYVDAFEQFDTATMVDIDRRLTEMEKIYGSFDIVIIDYLELVDPGDGKRYKPSEERMRRIAIGNKMKNLAIQHNVAVVTATQASDVDPMKLNNPDFYMTRHNVSECKGITQPFSYFITINQTQDEVKNNVVRLYADKYRRRKSKQLMKIATVFERQRFYDRNRTIKEKFCQVEFEEAA